MMALSDMIKREERTINPLEELRHNKFDEEP